MTAGNIVSETKNQIIVELKFDRNYFDNKIKSPSNFYKHLSNSKSTLPNGTTNRNWWKNLKPKGFYKYKINQDITEITLFFCSELKINEMELKCRIKKIGTPLQLEVVPGNSDYFSNLIQSIKNKEGVEKFGGQNLFTI